MNLTDKNQANGGGTDLFDIIMPAVQIIGWTTTSLCLIRFTDLPRWAAIVLGLPLFIVSFWGVLWVLVGRK